MMSAVALQHLGPDNVRGASCQLFKNGLAVRDLEDWVVGAEASHQFMNHSGGKMKSNLAMSSFESGLAYIQVVMGSFVRYSW